MTFLSYKVSYNRQMKNNRDELWSRLGSVMIHLVCLFGLLLADMWPRYGLLVAQIWQTVVDGLGSIHATCGLDECVWFNFTICILARTVCP